MNRPDQAIAHLTTVSEPPYEGQLALIQNIKYVLSYIEYLERQLYETPESVNLERNVEEYCQLREVEKEKLKSRLQKEIDQLDYFQKMAKNILRDMKEAAKDGKKELTFSLQDSTYVTPLANFCKAYLNVKKVASFTNRSEKRRNYRDTKCGEDVEYDTYFVDVHYLKISWLNRGGDKNGETK